MFHAQTARNFLTVLNTKTQQAATNAGKIQSAHHSLCFQDLQNHKKKNTSAVFKYKTKCMFLLPSRNTAGVVYTICVVYSLTKKEFSYKK